MLLNALLFKWTWTLFYTVLNQCLIVQIVDCKFSKDSFEGKISLGLYKEELSSPIFYQTYIPLVYEFQVPVWTTSDLTLRDWRGLCTSDDFSPSYTCPVFFHLEKFIERISRDLNPPSTLGNLLTRRFVSIASNTYSNSMSSAELCGKIQKHFSGYLTSSVSFGEYLDTLRDCPAGDSGVYIMGQMDYNYDIKSIYKSMTAKFEAEFANKVGTGTNSITDRIGPSYYLNALTNHQGIMLFNYYTEKNRWTEALNSCSANHLLPENIIKFRNFTNELYNLNLKLMKKTYRLSIPMENTYLYYRLPLADCSFIENRPTSFAVRLSIPVAEKNLAAKLYKIESVPFLFTQYSEDEKEKHVQICEVQFPTGNFIFDQVSGTLFRTNCVPGQLCYLPSVENVDLPEPCIEAYFSQDVDQVKLNCPFVCSPVDLKYMPKLPLFRQVGPSRWIITGDSNIGIVLKCDGQRDLVLTPEDLGALDITLPCSCFIMYHSKTYLGDRKSCSRELKMSWIFPIHYLRGNYSSILEINVNKSRQIDDDANSDETIGFPISSDSIEGDILVKRSNPELIILSKWKSQVSADFYIANANQLSSNSQSNSTSFVLLWLLSIVQLALLLGIIFFALYKYKIHHGMYFLSNMGNKGRRDVFTYKAHNNPTNGGSSNSNIEGSRANILSNDNEYI